AWYFQTIHHDLWDWDLVTGPMLFDVNVGGRTVKGVATAGKNCFLYVFHRETGEPINPIVETAVRTTTDVPGEQVWPTQPYPYSAKGVPMTPFCATFPIVIFQGSDTGEFCALDPGTAGSCSKSRCRDPSTKRS